MTDRMKLLIALLSDDEHDDDQHEDDEHDGGVTVFEVAAMLYELGDEYRQRARASLALAPA